MMFELFVGLSYKSTCVSFVLNPKAPKVIAIYMDSIYQEWFLCLKALQVFTDTGRIVKLIRKL